MQDTINKPGHIAVWFQQIRGPFLILAVVLTLIGIAAARRDGTGHWPHAVLLLIGVTLAHVSVNLFNELSDHQTGIDRHTVRTPFSGGSGMMQAGFTRPGTVSLVAWTALAVAAGIGIYFILIRGWMILFFMLSGGIAIRFYTSHLARWLIGEAVSGIALGSFVVLGVYHALSGRLTPAVLWLSIAPGILTALLLFLNEFPDLEADRRGGRRHLLIKFGRRRCARIYGVVMALVYVVIAISPLLVDLPATLWVALATLPLALVATVTVLKHHDDLERMVPALGMNVAVVIITDFLLAVGLSV